MPDLTPQDLPVLLEAFYARAFADPLLGHVFVDVARVDLGAHVPLVASFWERVLFGTGTYAGPTMQVHRDLDARVPLTAAHFARWLQLWRQTLAQGWQGPVADRAVEHGTRMASVFQRQLAQGSGRSLRLAPVT